MEVTSDQKQEIESLFENEELLMLMAQTSPFDKVEGKDEPVSVKLERQQKAIDAFSKLPESFWALRE